MAQALFYSSNAVAMTLAAGIASGDTTCNLSSTSGLPASFPFKLLIGWGTAQQEVVHCTALSGVVATITRGQDSTTAQAHSLGATVVHGVSAREFNDLEAHVAAVGAVHGLSGSVVGTTDAQVLTNKTLTAPIISTISNTGTLTLPTSTDTLVGRTTTDTLTNKTLTSAVLDAASTLGGVSGTSLAADRAAWTAYSPSFTNCTSPAGNFAYKAKGKDFLVRGYFNGGTVTAGGVIAVSLPPGVTAATGSSQPLAVVNINAMYAPGGGTTITSLPATGGSTLVGMGWIGLIEVQ